MKAISKLFIIGAVLALSSLINSCAETAIKSEVTSGNGIKLELLFEKDGCKVYRFYDAGYLIYWSDCSGRIEYDYRSNKTHRKQQTINN